MTQTKLIKRYILNLLLLAPLFTSFYFFFKLQESSSLYAERNLLFPQKIEQIRLYDEILTSSAKLYALSREQSFRDRYFKHVKVLDSVIQETLALYDDPEAFEAIRATDHANQELVSMEEQSFRSAELGDWINAIRILDSEAYGQQKTIYSAGLEQAFTRLEQISKREQQTVEDNLNLALLCFGISLLLISLYYYSLFSHWRKIELQQNALDTHRATMATVLDRVGNSLNQVGLILEETAAEGRLSPESAAVLERLVDETSGELHQIAAIKEHETELLAGEKVLVVHQEKTKGKHSGGADRIQ